MEDNLPKGKYPKIFFEKKLKGKLKVMDEREIGSWLEVEYWKSYTYPSTQQTLLFSGINSQQLGLLNPIINKQLEARGLPPVDFAVTVKLKKVPDPEFVAATAMLQDLLDRRSTAAKLKSMGMSTRKFNSLKAEPINNNYWKSRVNINFKDAEDTAKISLIKNIESGDLQSIKHFHEMTGIYRPNQEILLNMGVLIGRLMEVLAAHVDSKTLSIIGDQFNNILVSASAEVGELSA